MTQNKQITLDNSENTLLFKEIDIDGVKITECITGEGIYLYYSEIDTFKKKLDEIKNWWIHE